MPPPIPGIHHVTAICSDAQRNYEFYSGVLGLRLVKKTVNFDDPGTYHLYYGDGTGSPGTILTFFAWPGAGQGSMGTGQVTATAFSIPVGSIPYWRARLQEHQVQFRGPDLRFGEEFLTVTDPDGMIIELVATSQTGQHSAEPAIRGFHSATFSEKNSPQTALLLTGVMGFKLLSQDGDRHRYIAGSSEPGSLVDIVASPSGTHGRIAAGNVHHIAWRAKNDSEQAEWLKTLTTLGYHVSPVMDRIYFHSIYFREPGGILFEIATDPPGFTFDESAAELGSSLKLPPWLESNRKEIERILPPLALPVKA